ncbi:MAG: prohibitin family protein [Bacteroidia bacterium]|nr:prohibitin family protein [Bacteroidia bacterium]
MRTTKILGIIAVLLLSSCSIIRQGEVGSKRTLGRLNTKIMPPGPYLYNPFTTRILKTPVQSVNLEMNLELPSQDGLTINSDISILYHIKKEKVPMVLENIGIQYETIIRNVFRSSAADVCAKFLAKDMYSGARAEIEKQIALSMNNILSERGFVIEAVLLKSIRLPEGLSRAIESKLRAEQEAQQMEFVLQKEQKEAERKTIEAKGTRDANVILSEGLTDKILELRKIEALQQISTSSNAKVIITDGKSGTGQVLIQD